MYTFAPHRSPNALWGPSVWYRKEAARSSGLHQARVRLEAVRRDEVHRAALQVANAPQEGEVRDRERVAHEEPEDPGGDSPRTLRCAVRNRLENESFFLPSASPLGLRPQKSGRPTPNSQIFNPLSLKAGPESVPDSALTPKIT